MRTTWHEHKHNYRQLQTSVEKTCASDVDTMAAPSLLTPQPRHATLRSVYSVLVHRPVGQAGEYFQASMNIFISTSTHIPQYSTLVSQQGTTGKSPKQTQPYRVGSHAVKRKRYHADDSATTRLLLRVVNGYRYSSDPLKAHTREQRSTYNTIHSPPSQSELIRHGSPSFLRMS